MLITLDQHTDTLLAFRYYCCDKCENTGHTYDFDKANQMAIDMLQDSNIDDLSFIKKLNNDEHIDFATKKGIISKAFVISFECVDDKYDPENDKIYYIPKDFYNKYLGMAQDNNYERILSDNCIEDDDLSICLNEIPVDYHPNYILDIDLDFFRTAKSINPNKKEVFYHLIRQAKIITIATEPDYIEKGITADYLLSKILYHIEETMK